MSKINSMEINIDKSEFNKTLAPWIGQTSKLMTLFISDVFKKHHVNLTKEQWIVLKLLHEDQDGIIQNELAFITGRNKGSLTRLINVMEKNNLVVRISSKEDSRKNLIYITETGKETFAKMKPIMLQSIKTLQEGISELEINQFIKIMTKLQNNLKKHTN